MSDDAEVIAEAWRREFGAEVEWHLRRKIAFLEKWQDAEGARLYREVLSLCGIVKPVARVERIAAPSGHIIASAH